MNGLYFAGGVIGALMLPTVADKYGRKWACAFVCPPPRTKLRIVELIRIAGHRRHHIRCSIDR
jgi:MFS family permease